MTETTKHRQAFERYWRLGGGRTIERLHDELPNTPSLRTLYEWSRRYRWQQRIADIEAAARRVGDEARVEAVREMEERHIKEALLLQQKGTAWLSGLEAGDVTADAAVRALVEGVRLERLLRGEPTARTEIETNTGMEGLSDEQLSYLTGLAERALAGETEAQPG